MKARTLSHPYARPWACLGAGTLIALTLSGCHDLVTVNAHEADYDTEVTLSVARFDTEFLVRHALVPYALTATTIEMVADPERLLAPRTRSTTRHHVPIETTSTYLFDSGPCEFGGSTTLEASGATETYQNAMTFVTLDVTAAAHQCKTLDWQGYVTLTGRLDFDVTGWHDDLNHEIASLEALMTGNLRRRGGQSEVEFSNIHSRIIELSATDFRIHATAGLWLDDGWVANHVSLTTPQGVHWYRGDRYPHAGRVKLIGDRGWVELSFSASGVSRYDSRGNRQYWSWQSLN